MLGNLEHNHKHRLSEAQTRSAFEIAVRENIARLLVTVTWLATERALEDCPAEELQATKSPAHSDYCGC